MKTCSDRVVPVRAIEIENFKTFRQVQLELGTLTVLVGPHAARLGVVHRHGYGLRGGGSTKRELDKALAVARRLDPPVIGVLMVRDSDGRRNEQEVFDESTPSHPRDPELEAWLIAGFEPQSRKSAGG